MLLTRDIIKCAFFHSEEIGCIGSSQADMEWFKDVGYCFQGDRRGNGDFIKSISGKLYSKKFIKTIKPILKHHGYKETNGSITDVGQLAENGIGVCVANMSCGYYSPHSDNEVVMFDDANNCLIMINRMIDELGNNKYEYTYKPDYYNNYNFNYSSKNKWGDWSGADRGFWYDDKSYGTASQEVISDALTGDDSCYYCGCIELLDSQYGEGYAYCPDCLSDIYKGEVEEKEEVDPNQQEIDYEDISDNYDGSMEHKTIVNNYLTDYYKKKNK